MSNRVDLARRVLENIARGHLASTLDAVELRNWAVSPEDCVLPLEEIAHRILDQDERRAIAASGGGAPPPCGWRRLCAEFLMTDLEVAFTFLKICTYFNGPGDASA
jgi:hypothetical protein